MKDVAVFIVLVILVIGILASMISTNRDHELISKQEKKIAALTHELQLRLVDISIKEDAMLLQQKKIKDLEQQIEQMKLDLKIKWKGVK